MAAYEKINAKHMDSRAAATKCVAFLAQQVSFEENIYYMFGVLGLRKACLSWTWACVIASMPDAGKARGCV